MLFTACSFINFYVDEDLDLIVLSCVAHFVKQLAYNSFAQWHLRKCTDQSLSRGQIISINSAYILHYCKKVTMNAYSVLN